MALQNGLKILIIDDDRTLSEAVAQALENAGFAAAIAGTASEGWRRIDAEKPDLVILDLNLPDIDGIELCRDLRRATDIPIIMLTARTDETDRVVGLEVGADDYVTKPFSPRELVARVRAVLRRLERPVSGPEILEMGDLRLDQERHEVLKTGQPVDLTPTEFKLLATLMESPGRVFTRAELLEAVQGVAFEAYERTIDVHIKNLRRKIEDNPGHPHYIETVRGVGYRFSDR